jgi:hypothetical protein
MDEEGDGRSRSLIKQGQSAEMQNTKKGIGLLWMVGKESELQRPMLWIR